MSRGRIYEGDGDPRHGTVNGYANLGCRCEECRAPHREFVAAARARRAAAGLPDDDSRHGLSSTYLNYACRCDPCRLAHSAVRLRQWRAANAR